MTEGKNEELNKCVRDRKSERFVPDLTLYLFLWFTGEELNFLGIWGLRRELFYKIELICFFRDV